MDKAILELAEKLGRSINDSQAAAALRQARKELDQHTDIVDTLRQYQEQFGKIQQLEEQNKPVEVSDKHHLQELHDKLIASDVFKKFTAAQMEYVDMMRQVNTTLRKQLAPTEGQGA